DLRRTAACRARRNLLTASPTGGRPAFICRSPSPARANCCRTAQKFPACSWSRTLPSAVFSMASISSSATRMPRFASTPWALEIRPIVGVRNAGWEFIVNPIGDFSFGAAGEADFAPAARLARNLGNDWYVGLEYYGDFGKIGDFLPWQQQSQQLFAVTDFKVSVVDVELGVGYGFTPGSDRLVAKAIIGYAFPVPGKASDAAQKPLAMGTSARSTQNAW